MLYLQPHNLLIQKTLSEALEAQKQGELKVSDRVVTDFDYAIFHIFNDESDRNKLYVSIRMKAWESIFRSGPNLIAYLQGKFDGLPGISTKRSPETAYNYTLEIDIQQLTMEAIVQVSLLKVYVMSYVFQLAFDENSRLSDSSEKSQNSSTLHVIQYRENENIFIKSSADRITIIFETVFQGDTDKVFGKVFLQEFVDARKRNRFIQSAPQVLFSRTAPLEIASALPPSKAEEKSKRFITFVLFPRHFATPDLQFFSVCQLALFRNYFHYHIKCSKAYMHTRMRHRVDSFIKVLNRAKVEGDEEDRDDYRRTFTGRKMIH